MANFKFRSGLFSNPILLRLALALNPNNFQGLNVFRTLAALCRVLGEFLIRFILEVGNLRFLLAPTRGLRNAGKDRKCLVLGNGPSCARLDSSVARQLIIDGDLEIFASNMFPLTDVAKELSHQYTLVLSDSFMVPASDLPNVRKLWNVISSNASITLVIPTSWVDYISKLNLRNQVYFFNDLSLEGWTKNISPVSPRGYISITGLKALAFAAYQDFEQIFILGFDNSTFTSLGVSIENRIIQHSAHVPNAALFDGKDVTGEFPNGIADFFYVIAKTFAQLKSHFKGKNILNLDEHSLVDSFPKTGFDKLNLVKEVR